MKYSRNTLPSSCRPVQVMVDYICSNVAPGVEDLEGVNQSSRVQFVTVRPHLPIHYLVRHFDGLIFQTTKEILDLIQKCF